MLLGPRGVRRKRRGTISQATPPQASPCVCRLVLVRRVAAAQALSHLDPDSYRTFNLIVADNRDAFWLRHAGGDKIELRPIKEGLSLIGAGDIDDFATPRLAFALIPFEAAAPPDPDRDE